MPKELGSIGQVSMQATDELRDGVHYNYSIGQLSTGGTRTPVELCRIKFQQGPIALAGVNGASDESVVAILIDHINGFQSGMYASEANQQAVYHLQEALTWLRSRGASAGTPAPGKK